MSLIQLAENIRTHHVTSEAYVTACNARIDRDDPRILAWAWHDHRQALDAARLADRRGLEAASRLPLDGVPIAIKDIIDTAGMPTEIGSPIHRGRVPDRDAFVVERLKQLGAVIMGKTVTTEFAWSNPGKTHNPWNANHTPGGSSSGSAAAVAAGFVPAALGTQTMGSIIRPAAFCGVVGFKPSYGLISRRGIHPFANTLDHVGTFAHHVDDAGFLAHLLMGYDANDASCVATGGFVPGNFSIPNLKRPPRLALMRTPAWPLADDEQKNRLYASADTLRHSGAMVDELTLPAEFDGALPAAQTIMRSEAALIFAPLRKAHPDKVSKAIDDVVVTGQAFSAYEYLSAMRLRAALRAQLLKVMQGYDAIITPPATGEAPEGLAATGNPAFCAIWSLLGVPAINIPVALGAKGLPLGLQIVGGYRDDQKMLSVARWCEARLEFTHRC